MLVNIGKYSLCITGNDKLTCLLPPTWKEYSSGCISSDNRVQLFLEEGVHHFEDDLSDGWISKQIDGYTYAQYIHHGNVSFELQYNFSLNKNEVTVRIRKALDSYVRLGVHYGLMLALYQDCIGLHGVTLLCGNTIIILSAPSGTGKTTLSRLLEKYGDALVINGDFALLSVSDEGVIFEPTPFCGTSRRCLNHRVRIDRVVFLDQAECNHWQELSGREALIGFLNNSFVPSWDSEVENTIHNNILKCVSSLTVNAFSFAPTKEAAEVFLTNTMNI